MEQLKKHLYISWLLQYWINDCFISDKVQNLEMNFVLEIDVLLKLGVNLC